MTLVARDVSIGGFPKSATAVSVVKSDSGRVLALALGRVSEASAKAIEQTLTQLLPFITQTIDRSQRASLEAIVQALVPKVPPPTHLLTEARMKAQARAAVLNGAQWLTAAQLAELAGLSTRNPSAQPNKWKREGLLFAITQNGNDYFPGYALDADMLYRPHKGMAEVIKVFGARKDGWLLAYWFGSVNSYLGGRRPQDVLASAPDLVIAAAHDEAHGAAHG